MFPMIFANNAHWQSPILHHFCCKIAALKYRNFWCANFVETHSFRKVSGNLLKTLRKTVGFHNISNQEIRLSYDILCNDNCCNASIELPSAEIIRSVLWVESLSLVKSSSWDISVKVH